MADHVNEESWHNGFCSHVCGGDCSTCWAAWCCSPFLFGRTAQRMKYFPSTNRDDFALFNGDSALFCLSHFVCLQWLAMMLKRQDFRDAQGIRGDACKDCLVSCCCMPCGLAQMETEIRQRAEIAQEYTVGNVAYTNQQQKMEYQPTQPTGVRDRTVGADVPVQQVSPNAVQQAEMLAPPPIGPNGLAEEPVHKTARRVQATN